MISKEMLQYQSLDIELNRIEKDLRKNENFVKRKQLKALNQEYEDTLNKLDAKSLDLRNQLAFARKTIDKITAVLDEHSKEMEDIENVDELNYMNKKLNEQMEQLAAAEKDIKRILREGEEVSHQFDDIYSNLPRLASAINKCNDEVNKAAAEVKPRVRELQQKQAELKKEIDAALFGVYSKISEGGLSPVFVPLRDGNRCGGCQMEMPKAVVDSQMSSKGYVRCEHCGRIIYKQE